MYEYLKDSHPMCTTVDSKGIEHKTPLRWIDIDDGVGISFSYKGTDYALPTKGIGNIPERLSMCEFFAECVAEEAIAEYEFDTYLKERGRL